MPLRVRTGANLLYARCRHKHRYARIYAMRSPNIFPPWFRVKQPNRRPRGTRVNTAYILLYQYPLHT